MELQQYSIFIHPNNIRKLNSNIWAHEYVEAKLKIRDKQFFIKIAYRGNQIRKHKKKSYTIIFENPFLMDGQHEIHLNAEYNDASLMRNKLSFDFFESIGVLSPNSNHILLFINGQFHGVYLQIESFDEYYLRNRFLPEGNIFYATNDDANFSLYTPENNLKTTLTDGYTKKYDFQQDNDIEKLLITINTLKKEEFYLEIKKALNIKKYLLWLAGVVCTQNFDGFIHNYALYKNSKLNLFEISPWDYDGTWGRDLHGRLLEFDYVPIEGFNTLTARLLDCSEYRYQYRKILADILQNQFTVDFISPSIKKIYHDIQPYILKDPFIKNNVAIFNSEPSYILDFIRNRNSYLTNNLKNLEK